MGLGAYVFWDQGVGRFLDPVVQESVGLLRAKNEARANRFPKPAMHLLARLLRNHLEQGVLRAVPHARKKLQCVLRFYRQAVQLADHKVDDIVGITLGANAIEVPGPSPFTIIECEQTLLDKYRNQLNGEEWIARRLLMNQLCQRGDAFGFAVKRIPNQPTQVFTRERR